MLSAKLLDAAASHLPSAPSLAVLVRARDDPRSLHDGCSHHARHKLLHHANGSSGSCSAAAAQRRGVRGHALMLVTDSRPPVNSIDAYWSVSAAANALYAHIHGYDFVYAVLPESARFKRAATARSGRLSNHSHEVLHRRGRLPTWCRLVVVAAALDLGYAWVAALDSDTVIHQPYAKLGVLLRFAEREQTTSGSPSGKGIAAAAAAVAEARREGAAAIAMSNSWWTRGAPCAGNMVWRNQPLALPLLARWWAYDAEGAYGPGGAPRGCFERWWHLARIRRSVGHAPLLAPPHQHPCHCTCCAQACTARWASASRPRCGTCSPTTRRSPRRC